VRTPLQKACNTIIQSFEVLGVTNFVHDCTYLITAHFKRLPAELVNYLLQRLLIAFKKLVSILLSLHNLELAV